MLKQIQKNIAKWCVKKSHPQNCGLSAIISQKKTSNIVSATNICLKYPFQLMFFMFSHLENFSHFTQK